MMGPAEGRGHIDTRLAGAAGDCRLVELASVDSTQAEATRRAMAGERGPLWIRAGVQTQGRGRLGRGWATPKGNLAATLLFMPACPPAALHQLSLVTGVAVLEALRDAVGGGDRGGTLRLKWPNDLLAEAAKLGGILVESTTVGSDVVATIGIGINVAHAPDVGGRPVARLADLTAGAPALSALLAAIAARMDHWLGVWRGGEDFAAVREAWLAYGTQPGEPMAVTVGGQMTAGAFAGLDTDGALLLIGMDGATRRFTFGEVTLGNAKEN